MAYTKFVATLWHDRIYLFAQSTRVERLSRGLVSHTRTHCGPFFIFSEGFSFNMQRLLDFEQNGVEAVCKIEKQSLQHKAGQLYELVRCCKICEFRSSLRCISIIAKYGTTLREMRLAMQD